MDQYIWKKWGDNYDRLEPKFKVGGWAFWWDDDMLYEPPINTFSVTMHVAALSDAVYRCASNNDPFDSEWKRAISMYGRDSRARFWSTLYSGCAVGALRMSALNIIINEAILGLHVLTIDLNGLFTSDDGWVFYLLETRLGETFNQFHKNLPKEGLNSDEEGYEPIGDVTEILKPLQEILRQERDQAVEVIKRIRSSRELTQRFQIFDIFEGSQVNNEGWELHLDSQPLTQEDGRKGPYEVILRASQSEPAGLGEGYISWTAAKGTSHLVGFSTLPHGVTWEGQVKGGEA